MLNSSFISGYIGGCLVGLSALLLLFTNGRIAGISGIAGGILSFKKADLAWRVFFISGLWLGALLYMLLIEMPLDITVTSDWRILVAAGFLVGIGTRIGSGCTSGHGICGMARFSKRSIVATMLFMISGMVTVYLVRHVFYG